MSSHYLYFLGPTTLVATQNHELASSAKEVDGNVLLFMQPHKTILIWLEVRRWSQCTSISIYFSVTPEQIFYDVYDAIGELDNVLDTVKWGLEWLVRANPRQNELYALVGDPKIDHDYWGRPENFTAHR